MVTHVFPREGVPGPEEAPDHKGTPINYGIYTDVAKTRPVPLAVNYGICYLDIYKRLTPIMTSKPRLRNFSNSLNQG